MVHIDLTSDSDNLTSLAYVAFVIGFVRNLVRESWLNVTYASSKCKFSSTVYIGPTASRQDYQDPSYPSRQATQTTSRERIIIITQSKQMDAVRNSSSPSLCK